MPKVNSLTKEDVVKEIKSLGENADCGFPLNKKDWLFKAIKVYPKVFKYADNNLRRDEEFVKLFLGHPETESKDVSDYISYAEGEDEDLISVFSKEACAKEISKRHLSIGFVLEPSFVNFPSNYFISYINEFTQKELKSSFLSLSETGYGDFFEETLKSSLTKLTSLLDLKNLKGIRKEYYEKEDHKYGTKMYCLTNEQRKALDDEISKKTILEMKKETTSSKQKPRKIHS